MSEPKGLLSETPVFNKIAKWGPGKYFSAFLWTAVFVAVVSLILRNISTFGNILLVVLGFGTVILIHEFGHFIVAKLSGIKVEAFWIFMPPMLLGVRRTEDGLRFRILPKFFPKENDPEGDGLLSFTVGKKGKAGETEYRLGLVLFGGFVKMLGQDDVGPDKASNDQRSYANKPVSTRMAVLAAGVLFNAVSAVVIFMIVFLIGIKLPPAVVGGVIPDSPAAMAGLKAGDEIIEIDGKRDDLDFGNIITAAALSGVNEAIKIKVKHEDDSIEYFEIVAREMPGMQLRVFGIAQPQSLTIGRVGDTAVLLESTGLLPGDRIKAVNGRDVQTHWEVAEIVRNSFVPEITILAERTEPVSGKVELVESRIRLGLSSAKRKVKTDPGLGDIYSMVPRLRITDILGERADDTKPSLQSGDVILVIGNVENPTYEEMREVVTEYKDKELPIKVLRADAGGVEETLTVTVVPKWSKDSNRVMIGVGIVLDLEHSVVAKTVSAEDGPASLQIPRGAVVEAVDGVRVSNFYDVAREISQRVGQRITIDWRVDAEVAGNVVLDLGDLEDSAIVKSTFAEFVPFVNLKRLYKATGPIDAISMGYKRTIMFIAQTYVTLKRLIGGLVSTKNLMGPVGIVTLSYRIVAHQPLVYYVYFLGLISACIAVFNFLPLPPLDGGLIVLLLVEKVKGSAMSERAQGVVAYAGWVLIGTLFLYVTFNDIVRSFFS